MHCIPAYSFLSLPAAPPFFKLLVATHYSDSLTCCLAWRACRLNCFSHVWLFVDLWTVPFQAPLSMGFSRQEYWSGLPCPPPGDLPDPGIEHISLAGGFFTTSTTWLYTHFKNTVLVASAPVEQLLTSWGQSWPHPPVPSAPASGGQSFPSLRVQTRSSTSSSTHPVAALRKYFTRNVSLGGPGPLEVPREDRDMPFK